MEGERVKHQALQLVLDDNLIVDRNVCHNGYRELGTVGSYEKAWRYIDGSWYMFKHGNTQELISEYYSYQFLKAMGANVAEYEIQHSTSDETGIMSTFIITKDFTNNAKVDFEPFCNYYTDHDEPEYILLWLEEKLSVKYIRS